MTCFRVHGIARSPGNQVLVWLEDEQTGSTETPTGSNYVVRVPITDAPAIIQALVEAYAESMQRALVEVAAGGCRTCNNTRRVNDAGRGPCPVCIPRSEKRIRERVTIADGGPRNQRPPWTNRRPT